VCVCVDLRSRNGNPNPLIFLIIGPHYVHILFTSGSISSITRGSLHVFFQPFTHTYTFSMT